MGPIFTACYPVTAEDESNEVIRCFLHRNGYAERYGMVEKTNKLSIVLGCITACILLILCTCGYSVYKKQKEMSRNSKNCCRKLQDWPIQLIKQNQHFCLSCLMIFVPHECNSLICRIGSKTFKGTNYIRGLLLKNIIVRKEMLHLIDNILELARIENNQATLDETITDVLKTLIYVLICFRKG